LEVEVEILDRVVSLIEERLESGVHVLQVATRGKLGVE
jgi:hypothetical protein